MGPPKAKKAAAERAAKEEAERLAKEEEELKRKEREEEIARRLEARRKAEELHLKEIEWQKIRDVELVETELLWNIILEDAERAKKEFRESIWWIKYVQNPIDRPDPLIPRNVFTYISLWETSKQNFKTIVNQNLEALSLLEDISFTEKLYNDVGEFVKTSWMEQTKQLEYLIAEHLNQASFNVLLDAQNYINLQTGNLEFFEKHSNIVACLWASFTKNLKNRTFENEELQLLFEVPATIVTMGCAIQVLYTEYDHFSHYCSSFVNNSLPNLEEPEPPPQKPQSDETDLLDAKSRSTATVRSGGGPLTNTTPSILKDKIGQEETEETLDTKTSQEPEVEEEIDVNEINLNEMTVLGGIWHVQLLQVPPQPTKIDRWVITEEVPRILKYVPYEFDFTPPDPESENVSKKDSEELEAELLRQQEEMEKLVFMNIKLPEHIMWMENQLQPIIAMWNRDKMFWTTNNLYDIKFDEGKLSNIYAWLIFLQFILQLALKEAFPFYFIKE